MYKILILTLFSFTLFAQDEWFFKDILRGKIKSLDKDVSKVHYKSKSNIYYMDVSGDGTKEFILFEFNDGKLFMKIFDRNKKLVQNFEFPVLGHSARPYKISRKKISKNKILTLVHFFDGKTGYLKKTGTASLYGFVIENKKMKEIKVEKLASIYLESLDQENYLRRLYKVGFLDIDNDGQYELVVRSGSVKRILYHSHDNKWIGL